MKQILPDGRVQFSSPTCTFVFEWLTPAAILIVINGTDTGQFGPLILDEIRAEISRKGSIELFVDARGAVSASLHVSQEWRLFFTQHQRSLKHVHILVGSKFIELVVSIAQHLSRTGDLIQVYDSATTFDNLVARIKQNCWSHEEQK